MAVSFRHFYLLVYSFSLIDFQLIHDKVAHHVQTVPLMIM